MIRYKSPGKLTGVFKGKKDGFEDINVSEHCLSTQIVAAVS